MIASPAMAEVPPLASPEWKKHIEQVAKALKNGALTFREIRWATRLQMGSFQLRNALAAGEREVFAYEPVLDRWRLIGEPLTIGRTEKRAPARKKKLGRPKHPVRPPVHAPHPDVQAEVGAAHPGGEAH